MGNARRAVIAVVAVGVLTGGVVFAWNFRHAFPPEPGCTVTAAPDPGAAKGTDYTLDPAQAENAATIAAVGLQLGLPDHAVTVALATAMQESKLRNLPGGDRDSIGLFQQRPSQGWGTAAQISDPVYSATAFYKKLAALPNWETLDVTVAAQRVQRSGAPEAYAQWESEARAAATALTGERPAALTCHNLVADPSGSTLTDAAEAELGTATLSGHQTTARGWQIASWLVAHAAAFNLDKVSFDGRTWTSDSGAWSDPGTPDATLSLHQAPPTAAASPS